MSDSTSANPAFMRTAIQQAVHNVHDGGGPFAALVVREDEIIAQGANRVTASNDPTAHAEMVAIRAACTTLGRFHLDGCTLYTTCEPCPMCLGAIYWAHLDRVFYASTREDAAAAGFDDAHIYDEVDRSPEERSIGMRPCLSDAGRQPFDAWARYEGRVAY